MSSNVYLSIDLDDFESRKKEGIKSAKMNGDDKSMTWENLDYCLEKTSCEFRDGELFLFGSLKNKDLTDFGNLSVTIPLDIDTVLDIIEFYMKKLGKLKTVLEATK